MRPIGSFRSRLLRRHLALVALLLLGALAVYLAGNNLFPLIDRDEPRFAQASKQMVESGDWTTPHFLDEPRLNKPILIYWFQAASMKAVGPTAAAARFPSSIAAVLTLLAYAIALPSMVGHRRTFWTLLIFGTALMPVYLAKVCMADAVQHLFIAVAMLCLYRLWRVGSSWLTLITMGLAVGLAVLTKGPPVVMYLATTLVALWLLNRTIDEPCEPLVWKTAIPRMLIGIGVIIGLVLLVGLPWAIAVEHAKPGTLSQMISREVVERGTMAKEGHTGPPGFYLATFWITYFPWCLFWPAAVVQGWKRRHLPWVRFSLAAVIGPWIFLEIYKTKLPHYWLPSYPFMAILTADVVLRGIRARIVDLRDRPFLIGARVWAGAAFVAAVCVTVVPFFGDRPWAALPVAVLLALGIAAFAVGVVVMLVEKRLQRAAITMALGMWAIFLFVTCAYLPHVGAITLPSRVAANLCEIGATVPNQVQMIGFKEPSLAFYQGGTIREQSDNGYLIKTPREEWPRWTVIDDELWKKSVAAVPAVTGQMIERGTFRGSAYAAGRRSIVVHVLEKKITPTTMP